MRVKTILTFIVVDKACERKNNTNLYSGRQGVWEKKTILTFIVIDKACERKNNTNLYSGRQDVWEKKQH